MYSYQLQQEQWLLDLIILNIWQMQELSSIKLKAHHWMKLYSNPNKPKVSRQASDPKYSKQSSMDLQLQDQAYTPFMLAPYSGTVQLGTVQKLVNINRYHMEISWSISGTGYIMVWYSTVHHSLCCACTLDKWLWQATQGPFRGLEKSQTTDDNAKQTAS